MALTISRYPLKGPAVFMFFMVAPISLAALALLDLPSGRRPIREWSLKTTMGLACLKLFHHFATHIQLQPVYADSKKLGERYVLVQHSEARLYRSILDNATIKPKPMPAIWCTKRPAGGEN
jgi:hypothetical protein